MAAKDFKILVADDSKVSRKIIKTNLEKFGYEKFIEVDNGLRALDKLKKNHVDLIISDWIMPEMDGLALLEAVRADKELCHIPFIMLTAEIRPPSIKKAVDAQVSGYLMKPFVYDDLKEQIDKALGQ